MKMKKIKYLFFSQKYCQNYTQGFQLEFQKKESSGATATSIYDLNFEEFSKLFF